MFFKKGLKDSSLIYKLTMKNPRISEEMLAIANKYVLTGIPTETLARIRSWVSRTNPAHPRAVRRRGSRNTGLG
jgi:hypothetical protein